MPPVKHGGGREAIPEGMANPLPLLMPAADLLEENGHAEAGRRILEAAGKVLEAKESLTFDLGGKATSMEMANAVIRAMG